MQFIIFKKYGRIWAIPSSQTNKPQVKRLLEGSILLEIPEEKFFVTPKVYKIKKVLPKKRRTTYKPKPMPLGLQKHILEKKVKKYGLATDIIDWDVLDSKLRFSENEKMIMDQIKGLTDDINVLVEKVDPSNFDYETKRFINDLIWKWETGETEHLKEFGIDPKKIKSKEDLLKIFL
ncbi:MAG: hypothetical protein QW228_05930 [Candidatus Aenigmatarchaeota archaeon]